MSEYRFEVFKPELLDQVVRLRQELWGGSRSDNIAYFIWRYLENPYLADPLVYVARHQGRVVGMRSMYGTGWVVPGIDHVVILPCAADTGITEQHRGNGLYADLTGFAMAGLGDQGLPYVINMSATPANLITSIMTMGWRKVGSFEPLIRSAIPLSAGGPPAATAPVASVATPLVRQLKRSEQLRRVVRKARTARRNAFGRNPFGELDQHLRHAGSFSSVEVTSEPRPSVMANLAARFDDPRRIHHLRDETYFAWRYSNPMATRRWSPDRVHRRFLFLSAGNDAGYAVLQGDPGGSRVDLVDWTGDEGSFAELLRIAITLIKPEHLGTWAVTVPAPFKQRLDQSGFVPDGRDSLARRKGLIVKALLSNESDKWTIGNHELLDITNWDLRMIQSDALM